MLWECVCRTPPVHVKPYKKKYNALHANEPTHGRWPIRSVGLLVVLLFIRDSIYIDTQLILKKKNTRTFLTKCATTTYRDSDGYFVF